MTIDHPTADNLLCVLAAAAIAIPDESGTNYQRETRARVRALYSELAEMYAAAGFDVVGLHGKRKVRK